MTLVVYALGGVLVLAGAVFILMGVPIVHLEQGWTEVIAGSVAGAAGFVIIVLGMFLYRLEALQLSLEALASAGLPVTAPIVPDLPSVPVEASDEPARDPDDTVEALDDLEAAHPVPLGRPSEVAAVRDEPRPAPAWRPVEERGVEPEPMPAITVPPNEPVETADPAPSDAPTQSPRRHNFLASFLAKRIGQPSKAEGTLAEPAVEPVLTPLNSVVPPSHPGRTSIDLSSGWAEDEPEPAADRPDWFKVPPPARESVLEVLPEPALDVVPEAPAYETDMAVEDQPTHPPHEERAEHMDPAEPEDAERNAEMTEVAPTVVGRYSAGSASYVMYSNGMIEVETDTGIHQFASMQELKAFIEQQDKAQV